MRFKTGARSFVSSPVAFATALALVVALPAQAQFFSSSGAVSTAPVNFFPINPASPTLDFTGNTLRIGDSATGSFAALAGALLKADAVTIANGATGNGSMTVTGAGTLAQFGGTSNRLEIGNWGVGSLLVSAGGVVDATVNAGACTVGVFCYTFIGNAAGSTGTLTVTGAGSELRALRSFVVGQTAVFTLANDGFTFGTPGGTTNAFVNVLAGGTLRTQQASVGSGPSQAGAVGTERGFGTAVVDGAGSRWIVTHNTIDNTAAGLTAGNRIGGQGTISISNGGKLIIDGSGGIGPNDFLNLGVNGGRGDLSVSGVGSSVEVKGFDTAIQVGRSGASGQGSFSVLAGATASALHLNIGRDLATGSVLVDGAGSQLSLVGVAMPGTGGAGVLIGATGGNGQMTLSNGGHLLISDGGGDSRLQSNSLGMTVGREAGSTGSLTITGAGSTVQMTASSLSPGVGVADNFNPGMVLGRDSGATGTLQITNGGKLLMQGDAVSTVANSRSTAVNIGGSSDVSGGGTGTALVSGIGSELTLSGNDRVIHVGRGAGAIGQLTVSNGGSVSATNMGVGRSGGFGTLVVDGATLGMSGQQTGNNLSGASLSIGQGGGTGVATITNGSHVDITNAGSAGASLNLGGTGIFPLGNGTLTVAGGSQVNVTAPGGKATFSIGRDGTGFATIKENSSVNVGDGSTFIGRLAGSNGTLRLESGGSLNAGYVGVGRTPAGDGGTGHLVIDDSTVTATTVEVGTAGFLSGNNGTINGDVILHGTLSPGDSPGRIVINGSLRTGSGHLILDVADDGAGGFETDHLILTLGSTFDFTGLEVTFNFLGSTDPNAFAASGGFDLDNFLQSQDPGGNLTGLSTVFAPGETWNSVFATAEFNAESDAFVIDNLRFSPDGGASFSAAAVPEPGTWALMLIGFAAIGAAARRRATARLTPITTG